MKKLLIIGDSFSSDWTKKYKYNGDGWVNMLSNNYDVTNLSQAGVSEYKVYLQLDSINPKDYDHIIVSHTSAYRIPIQEHPIHKGDILHKDCDIIYADVVEHMENPIMKTAYDFYCDIFNPEYFSFINNLIFDRIYGIIPNATHITFFDSFYDDRVMKFENVLLKNKGLINHLNEIGNKLMYNKLLKVLEK